MKVFTQGGKGQCTNQQLQSITEVCGGVALKVCCVDHLNRQTNNSNTSKFKISHLKITLSNCSVCHHLNLTLRRTDIS